MWRKRTQWLAVRKPLPARSAFAVTVLAFLLPLLSWCIVSYVPFVWHPQVRVTDAGDTSVPGDYSYLAVEQRVDLSEFEARNAELSSKGATLAVGERVNPIYLPPPHEVARAFYTAFTTPPQRTGDQWLHESLWHSCQVIFWGFVYASLFAIPLGILCGTFGLFSRLLEPFVGFVRYMPAPVFGALAVAVFGLADAPKVTIVFIGTFFPMVLVVAKTTRQLDGALLQVARTLGANDRQLLTHVVIPGVLPNLYRDMRVLVGWAWTYLLVAELIGEKSGISAFIDQQQRYRHFDNVYASIVMIGLIAWACDQLLVWFGKYLFPWESGKTALPRLVQKVKLVFSNPPRAPKPVGEAA
jgi:NitT/TauT family transport system permease protein